MPKGPPGNPKTSPLNVLILPVSSPWLKTQLVFRVGAARFLPSGSHQPFGDWEVESPKSGAGPIGPLPAQLGYELG
eukprot:s135_g27.t1